MTNNTDASVVLAPTLPAACGPNGLSTRTFWSVASTSTTITATRRAGTTSTSIGLELCGPFGTDGAIATAFIFDHLHPDNHQVAGTALTITHTGANNTGDPLASGTDYWVRGNSYAATARWQHVRTKDVPVVTSASVNGDRLTIAFSRNLAAAANLANGAFAVKRTPQGGTEEDVDLAGAPAVSGRTVTLTLAEAVADTDTDVKVSYTKPASGTGNAIVDADGNAAPSFADRAVANVTPSAGRPHVTAVEVASAPRLDLDGDGTNETYGAGQRIVVDVTWNEAVTWDVSATGAAVRLRLDIGGTARLATLETGGATSGSARWLRFAYTVADGDTDGDGFAVAPGSDGDVVVLQGGATLTGAGGVDAGLRHAGLSAGAGHRVNGARLAPDTNRAPVYSGADPGVINAPPLSLVRYAADPTDFSDPDGDLLRFAVSADRDDVYEASLLVHSNGYVFFRAKPICALAHISPPLSLPHDEDVTLTAYDPDGASVQVTGTFRITFSTCPSFSSASVNRSSLTILLDGDAKSVPGADEFVVKVDGTAVPLAATDPVSASGRTITLTLASAVAPGQAVTVSYVPDAESLAADEEPDAPAAVAFADKAVTEVSSRITAVAVTSTPTHDSDGGGTGDTYRPGEGIDVTVTWDRDVTWDVSAQATSAIVAQLDLGDATRVLPLVTGGADSGTARSLTFRHTVLQSDADSDGVALKKIAGDAVVALAAGATLKDASGVDVALEFADLDTAAQADHMVDGSLAPDGTAPTVAGASVNGAALTITFDETLGAAPGLSNDAFTVKKTRPDGTEVTVALGGSPSVSAATLTLTLAEAAVSADRNVKVSYAKPGQGTDNRLADLSGNEAASFAEQAVANATPPPVAPCAASSSTVVLPEHLALSATASTVAVSYTDRTASSHKFQLCAAGSSAVTESGSTQAGSHTFTNLAADTDHWVRVQEGSGSPSAWKHVRTLPAAPTVTGVAVTSTPTLDSDGDGTGDTYRRGDAIDVTVTWDRDVTWDVSAAGSVIAAQLNVGDATGCCRW